MAFRKEPSYRHGTAAHTAVVLVNLGTPDAPTAPALRRYLAEFLSDPRVVEIPKPLWWLILHGIILRIRPAKSAAKYASIWMKEGSPLAVWTARQAEALQTRLSDSGHPIRVVHAMRYGNPGLPAVLDRLRAEGVQRMLAVPLYPQYAAATTGSAWDAIHRWNLQQRRMPEWRFVNHYHDDPRYIQALVSQVQAHWAVHGRGERLLLTFHGVPERSLHLGDPYHCECQKTARLVREGLGLPPEAVHVTFQSRFGRAKWLGPYTEPTLIEWAHQGVRSVDVMCPGFTSDCLETLEEISQEAREAFLHAGGTTFQYIPCLNDQPQWLDALADLTRQHLQGWDLTTPSPQALAQQRAHALALGAKQ